MGAYSNPEILVDTQSGQHWRNLQKTIADVSSDVFENAASIVKKNQEYGEIADKNTMAIKTLTQNTAIKNPRLDIPKSLNPLVDEYEKLQNDIAFGRSKNILSEDFLWQYFELGF